MLTLKKLVDDLDFEVIYGPEGYCKREVTTKELNRPGLQLCDYYNSFVSDRFQIIGVPEWQFMGDMSREDRYRKVKRLLSRGVPALIISSSNRVYEEIIEAAKETSTPIFSSSMRTTKLINSLINYLDMELAPTTRVHGVLMDIYGVGVLITGSSGVGKSETALELVGKGHKLIADDSVIIKQVENNLVGFCPEITKYFVEIRGVGIIDVKRMYGIGSVMEYKHIDLVVQLENKDENKDYERLGLDDNYTEILGQKRIIYEIPVSPGRNSSLIIEIATRSFKQKEMGHNSAKELNDRIISSIESRKNGDSM